MVIYWDSDWDKCEAVPVSQYRDKTGPAETRAQPGLSQLSQLSQ